MAGTASTIPRDLPTLARWLAQSPEERVPLVEKTIQRATEADYREQAEFVRLGLKWAWDEQPKRFFGLLKPWLGSSKVRLRRLAVGSLPTAHEDYRDRCRKALKKLSSDKDREVRLAAISHLLDDVDGSFDLIKRWVKQPEPAVRAMVADRLGGVRTENIAKALPLLALVACDPDPDVHWGAATSYQALYEREPREVIKAVRVMAESDDASVRWAVAGAFFQHVLADKYDNIRATLRAWLKDGNPNLRWTLARGLRFVTINNRSLQLLRALYEDKNPDVRVRVVDHLVASFDPLSDYYRAIADMLRRAREDSERLVCEAAQRGEERLGLDFLNLPLDGRDLIQTAEPEQQA